MLLFIDDFLNRITMYRLTLYVLSALIAFACGISFFGLLPFRPSDLLFSTIFLVAVSWLANAIFAKVYEAPTNIESVYITAFILALIITPPLSGSYLAALPLLFWAGLWAMASKFIFAIGKKHLFNPAAFAVALTALAIGESASWWVGTGSMLIPVAVGGILIARKLRRSDLVWSFIITALVTTLTFGFLKGTSLVLVAQKIILDSPVLFFSFIMLTEPLTTPPSRVLRVLYGAFVGFLFAPQIHLGSFYSTPELALLAGNLFSYLASPKEKLFLSFKEKIRISADMYDFVFTTDRPLSFKPGQYLEWTLAHKKTDSRGNRRYFTIASSPTEREIKMGVRFYERASSFKQTLLSLQPGQKMIASQLAGDFVMPKKKDKKLAFIAGGIGITPFRSMIRYLLDTKEKRSIVLLYVNKSKDDIAYGDVFSEAAHNLNVKTVYTLTDLKDVPQNWRGATGRISEDMIRKEVPDYADRIFYISGPRAMVLAYQEVLKNLGIPRRRIKIDFFPGFV